LKKIIKPWKLPLLLTTKFRFLNIFTVKTLKILTMKYVKAFLILFTGITLLNSCAKEFSLESNGIKTPAGNWEFKDSTTEFSGTMDTAFISGNSGSRELHLLGTSAEGNDQFSIILFADTITTGTYKTSLFQSLFTY